jgi:hypothetical protein
MSFRLIAFHHPTRQHHDEMLGRMTRASEIMRRALGCIDAEVWREQGSGAPVSTAKFESRDACMAALQATAKATDIQFDEREERPREVYNLVDPDPLLGGRS